MFFSLNAALFALCIVPSVVRSHITPTGPIPEIRGGEERAFYWGFDKNGTAGDPFAREGFRVDLMWGKEHWVAILAKNISIYDNGVRIRFLPEYGFSSSAYYVRYMTYKTNEKVYTENFTLSHMNGQNLAEKFKEYPDRDMASHGSGGLAPANSDVNSSSPHTGLFQGPNSSHHGTNPTHIVTGPTTTAPVTLSSSLGIQQATSQTGRLLGPTGVIPSSPTEEPNLSSGHSGAMSLSRERGSAWQQTSLILWPVLVGAAMAM